MTPPAIRLTKPEISIASSNYVSNSIESLNTLRLSTKTSFGGSFNADFGADTNIQPSEDGFKITTKPAFEAKYKQNIAKLPLLDTSVNFRAYSRYRHIGDTNQLRVAAGAGIPLNDKLTVYADAHYTTKFEENKDKVGFWTGLDYKATNNFSLWCEGQVNKTINGSWDSSANAGLSYSF